MLKSLCLISVLVYLAVDAAPAGLGSLEYDRLNTDLDDLKYEVEEEDLDDISKLIDEADNTEKSKVKASGSKKKTASNKGSKKQYDIEDLKKFFKTTGLHDQGVYDDDDIYAVAEGFSGSGVGVKGNEDRKYKKGTKTRGFHRVHHKDEYKKDKVFYEDDETSGSIKKVGAKGRGHKLKAGAGFEEGHFHHDRLKGVYGKQGSLDKGFSNKKFNNFADSQGFEETFSNSS